jgi:guanosine-3',5'-bis(diphosphate) 3'-pyrophosphohydrolase
MDVVSKARMFAAQRHGEQKRKYSDEPYAVHLEAVVDLLRKHGITDATVLAAAYLHDTIEDTDTKVQDLIKEFGADIAQLVYWLSDMEKGNRASRTLMSAWRLSRAPFDAKLIKCADVIDNTINIGQHDPNFARVFADEKQHILQHMAAVEGTRLTQHALYLAARRATGDPSARPPSAA